MHLEADLVLDGATVLTFDSAGTVASSIAIRGNTIVAVGDADATRPWIGPATRRVNVSGKTVMPGVVDAHCHLASDAQSGGSRVECRDFYAPIRSIKDITDRMAAAAREHPELTEIAAVGSPMQEFRLAEKRRPTQAELDAAVPDRPAYVTFGAHILVANTLAVEKAGVTNLTPDPQGGIIERNPDGRPNGVFRERARFLLISRESAKSFDEYKEGVRQRLLDAAARGCTTIHDIVASRDEVKVYQALEREGRLPIRVQLLIRVIESQFNEWSLLDLGIQPEFGSDMLRVGGIKMSIDGGFTARQGLFHPVDHEPEDNHPLIRITQEELDEAVIAYHAAGMRICVHAIGDLSLDMILDSYAAAIEASPRRDHRHRIEHMTNFIASDEQIAKAKALGITPMPNPSVLFYLAREAFETLTEERMTRAIPIRLLLDEGFAFAPGSDAPGYWPVDPIRDAAFCVSRRAIDDTVVVPEQAITNDEALRCITKDAAWVGFMEDKLGTVEVGKLADLVVLASDPRSVSGEQMMRIPVELTVVDGKVVFGDE
jgi:predicted amidohydrolase YtcJ